MYDFSLILDFEVLFQQTYQGIKSGHGIKKHHLAEIRFCTMVAHFSTMFNTMIFSASYFFVLLHSST